MVGGVRWVSETDAAQLFDSTLVFACSSGYTGTVTYTCGSEGFTTLDACSAVICDGSTNAVAVPENADAANTGTAAENAAQLFDSTLVATCTVGYPGKDKSMCRYEDYMQTD